MIRVTFGMLVTQFVVTNEAAAMEVVLIAHICYVKSSESSQMADAKRTRRSIKDVFKTLFIMASPVLELCGLCVRQALIKSSGVTYVWSGAKRPRHIN